MADKEERYISITQMVAKENIETEKYRVMPRQEAIERMAKAIFNYYTDGIEPQNWELKEVRDNFNKVAEAALNALLEGHNDER